jgi:glycosyltransferase involved in cell wall biosynthesis
VPWLEILVPARNEESRLPAGLAELTAKAAALPPGVSITVVDNASSDATASVARDWPQGPVPVRVLNCDRPGKGAAVRAGLLATQAPYVGFCDADMATDLSALATAVDLLLSGDQLVIASRAHPRSDVQDRHSVVRRAGAAAFRAWARAVVPGVMDTQCGFKFFAGPVARAAAARMRATGFAFDIELIARCRQLGAEPVEIPVTWRDVPGSRFSVWRHSVASFAEVAGIWLTMRRRRERSARAAASWPPTRLNAVPEVGGARIGRTSAGSGPAHRKSS